MSEVARAALYTKLTGDDDLVDMLSDEDAVFYGQAPEDAEYPLVIFHKQGGTKRRVHAGSAWKEEVWLVKGVARESSADAGDIADQIDALLDQGSISVPGFMSLIHRGDVAYPEVEKDKTYRHAGATYALRYQGA